MAAASALAVTESDLARCADEPIHIPGSIQPHGILLAADSSLTITHVSGNLQARTGRPAADVLGQPLRSVIGDAACGEIVEALSVDAPPSGTTISRLLPMPAGLPGGVLAHRHNGQIIVELEPAAAADYEFALAGTLDAVSRLRGLPSVEALCGQLVRSVRALTGYDRVMVYRFSAEDHGEIIAEDRPPELEPYLHLRYPATDIPAQARRLYVIQRVRVIPSIGYAPVPVLGGGPALDMSYCALRSVSPVHLEYLRNMDVAATLGISIVQGDRLWGMIICHHRTALTPSPGLRALCELVGQMTGLLIAETEERERATAQRRAQQRLAWITQHLESGPPSIDRLGKAAAKLLELVNASGVFIRLNGQTRGFGEPPPARISGAILAALQAGGNGGGEIQAISNLAALHPRFKNHAATASGVLMVPLVNAPEDGLLFFRPEVVRTVQWGGDPRNKAEFDPRDGRIRPRRSFAAWSEIMRRQAEPWSQTDVLAARELGPVITRAMLRHAEAELQRVANSDPLTGLPNRPVLERHLAAWRQQDHARPAALLLLDIDRFKTVNDSLGHNAGDTLLRAIGNRLADVAGPHLLVRLGGDDFALFGGGLDETAAGGLAGRILALFETPFSLAGRPHRASVSIGIAVAGTQATAQNLLREADAAMYAAKREGGSRAAFFRPPLHNQVLEKLRTEQDLFLALDREELVLHYQPIVRLSDRRVIAHEALVRWRHPERGMVPPGSFISLAEETGLIGRIGLWVAREAMRQLAELNDPEMRFGINVSALQLLEGQFSLQFMDALAARNLSPNRIILEVTEGALMRDEAVAELERLRALGCRISIDDFGTGYSSLAYLRRLPVHTVKIDRSFLLQAQADPQGQRFLRAIIDLAHTLNLRVVGEGVETEAQCALLKASGCDAAQGYLFGRPAPLNTNAEPTK
jgi:diguanylate cyclase (GGDEF)-like protein